jgi:hypothetical protein
MPYWPKAPTIYEINTWVWLHDLSQRYQRTVTLGNIPSQEWDMLAAYRFDAVWLMGVWERSPAGQAISRQRPDLQSAYRNTLPDFTIEDVVGSPYSIRRYVVDTHLGGPEGLAAAREALRARSIRLLLDFVPNHVAPDHPWIFEHPEYLIQGDATDLEWAPHDFFEVGGHIFAHGRDPYFPPWPDTAQLHAFHPGLRAATIATLHAIARQCDGVRCDMAMLLMQDIFAQTWGQRAGDLPPQEFWKEIIGAVRRGQPDFLFLAEAYWDREWALQKQGFNYCYDKQLYDRLRHATVEPIRLHLTHAALSYQDRLVRFIENHDEPRAAAVFNPYQVRAAAITAATLPGARLFHQGQFEGFRVKGPIQLGRHCSETVHSDLQAFYRTLLTEIAAPVFHTGTWQLCDLYGWPDNASWHNLLAWCWRLAEARRLVVVNLSAHPAQGRLCVPWDDVTGGIWRFYDPFNASIYRRDGDEIRDLGLFVDLLAYEVHFFTITREL